MSRGTRPTYQDSQPAAASGTRISVSSRAQSEKSPRVAPAMRASAGNRPTDATTRHAANAHAPSNGRAATTYDERWQELPRYGGAVLAVSSISRHPADGVRYRHVDVQRGIRFLSTSVRDVSISQMLLRVFLRFLDHAALHLAPPPFRVRDDGVDRGSPQTKPPTAISSSTNSQTTFL